MKPQKLPKSLNFLPNQVTLQLKNFKLKDRKIVKLSFKFFGSSINYLTLRKVL